MVHIDAGRGDDVGHLVERGLELHLAGDLVLLHVGGTAAVVAPLQHILLGRGGLALQ